ISPEFLEAVRCRQRFRVIPQMVLAELACRIPKIVQELGERRRAGPQVTWTAWQLRWDHARSQRMHAGEEGVASRRTALLGVVVHEYPAFATDAIDVGCLSHHQSAMVDTGLHPADVVTHDEEDVRSLPSRSLGSTGFLISLPWTIVLALADACKRSEHQHEC